MKINSIKIENLFEIFDYDISFKTNENVLIITGPNGFGKTMILNIIFNLFNRKFFFFYRLVFDKITLCLDENIKIIISKKDDKGKPTVRFAFFKNEKEIGNFDYSDKLEIDIERNIQKYLPLRRYDNEHWIDHRTGKVLSIEDLLNEYADQLPDEIFKNILQIEPKKINDILDSIQVHLIREQRLFKKAKVTERNYREEKEHTVMTESIQTYAKELERTIANFLQRSFMRTQELDSSYPKRLTSENHILPREEYEAKYNALKSKQEKLTKFGLYDSRQEFLGYNNEDAKALSVYLKDLEQKLGVFDELIEKLELFADILNKRRFTYKSIKINPKKGFYFETTQGKELKLAQLSSGEQHEVVLLYELIFNVKPNVLVLLDEPEISLHVSWQKEFLNDLLKIIKIQNIQVLIATHSPSIVNDRWDLVYNLEDAGKNEKK